MSEYSQTNQKSDRKDSADFTSGTEDDDQMLSAEAEGSEKGIILMVGVRRLN